MGFRLLYLFGFAVEMVAGEKNTESDQKQAAQLIHELNAF